jgi:hypothetical protein
VPPSATPTGRSAILSELKNEVQAREAASADWLAAAEGQQIGKGGGAKTGAGARARVDISDGSLIRLAEHTEFTLKTLSAEATDPVTRFSLTAGRLWVEVTKALGAGEFEVETPTGSAGVRGSLMGVAYGPDLNLLVVSCLEGACQVMVSGVAPIRLQPGQQVTVLDGTPTPVGPISREELALWSEYFPEARPAVAAYSAAATATIAAASTATALAYTPTPAGPSLAAIAGDWSGTVQNQSAGFSAGVSVSIPASCQVGGLCGTFQYTNGCTGGFTLSAVTAKSFLFVASRKQGCSAAMNYTLQPLADGTLAFSNETGTAGILGKK